MTDKLLEQKKHDEGSCLRAGRSVFTSLGWHFQTGVSWADFHSNRNSWLRLIG